MQKIKALGYLPTQRNCFLDDCQSKSKSRKPPPRLGTIQYACSVHNTLQTGFNPDTLEKNWVLASKFIDSELRKENCHHHLTCQRKEIQPLYAQRDDFGDFRLCWLLRLGQGSKILPIPLLSFSKWFI